MAQNTSTVREKVMAKINLAPDLQLHIRTVKTDGLEMVDLRQWIPSLDLYGRGVLFEARHLTQVIEELQGLHKHVGVGNSSRAPGRNQARLPGV